MTELPPELKKAEHDIDYNAIYPTTMGYERKQAIIPVIPSSVVASFLETARKELDKLTCYHPEERHSCYIEPESCLVNREEIDAVLGEEGK